MGFPLHTVNVTGGATPPVKSDELVVTLGKDTPFAPAANSISAIDQVNNAGTGYTQLPAMAFTGGTGSGGIAVVTGLKAVTATVAAAGVSYSASDTITLSNGVILTVLSRTGTGVATVGVTTAGVATPTAPVNPLVQVSTNNAAGGAGGGQGATFTVLWGINAVQIINSGSYTVAPTGASFTPANGQGSNGAVQSIHLGGNGLPIYVGLSGLELPQPMMLFGQASVPAITSTAYKRFDVQAVRLDPITAAVSIAAGTCDLLAVG